MPQLDIDAGAVSDESGNLILAAPDQTIDTYGTTTPPSVESVTYDTNLRLLFITFDDPVTALHYTKMHIRDTGNSTGGITLSSISPRHHNTANTVSVLLDGNKKATFDEMSEPQLDMDSGAVSDFSGNGIAAQNDIPIVISDTIRPVFESARYSTGDDILSITFSENVTVGSSQRLYIHDVNHNHTSGISLGTADLSSTPGNVVNATLNPSQVGTVDGMHAPRLHIPQGTVSDGSDNEIAPAADLEIIIDDAVPPALVHAEYSPDDDTVYLTFSMHVDNPDYTKLRIHDSGADVGSIQFNITHHQHTERNNMTVLLSDTQEEAIESMAAPQLDIDAGAVSDAADASNTIRPAANLTLSIPDTIPPELDSATYTTGDGMLTVVFSEPISLLNYAKMHIIDLNFLGWGISLADVASIQHTAGTDTMTATLDQLQRTAFETMENHNLRIDRSAAYETAAAYDMSANAVLPGSLSINVSDTTPPAFVSSTYDAALNTTTVTFDESIPNPDYSKMHIRGSGSDMGGITLGDVSQRQRSMNSLSVTFDESQNDAFVALGTTPPAGH